jgi:hypothetical protein
MGRKAPGASEKLNKFSDTFERIKCFSQITDPDRNLKAIALRKFKNHADEQALLKARVALLERRHSAPCNLCWSDDEEEWEGYSVVHYSDSESF